MSAAPHHPSPVRERTVLRCLVFRVRSQGSCGYGMLDKTEWPYWSVAALSTKSPFYLAGPLRGCG